ncbi:AP-4 complex subunit mu-1-like [Styela clava]
MLNGVFLINSLGDVLACKNLSAAKYTWSPKIFFQRGLQKFINKVLPPCIEIDNVFYTHASSDEIFVVAVSDSEEISPILMMISLQNFIKECADLIGDMKSENVLLHSAVVYELLIQTFGLSHPDNISQHAINECKQMGNTGYTEAGMFPFMPENLFGVSPSKEEKYMKESSASKAPLASQQEKKNEIFVDLIEYLIAIIDKDGQVIHADIKGSLSTKSYLTNTVSVQIALPDKIIEENPTDTSDTDKIFITAKRFRCKKSSKETQNEFPLVKHLSGPGLNPIMDYNVASDNLKLPFTMYHNFSKTNKGSMIELALTCKIFCALPLGISPINWSASFPLPSKLISVSGTSSLKSIHFTQSKDKRTLHMQSPVFPAQSHHSITLILLLSEILPFMVYEMPHLNIKFEVPNLCISNMRIQSLKVQNINSNTSSTVTKWARCVTHSNDYTFELKYDWI